MRRFDSQTRQRTFKAAIAGGIAFTLLTTAAMLAYPGGTRQTPQTDHYLFASNFFSDLGRTQDFEGNSNFTCMLLFGTALSITGCTTVALFFVLPDLFQTDRRSRILSNFMTAFGLLAGIGFVGVAFTPWDLFLSQHDFCVNLGFRCLLLACMCAMINVYGTDSFPNRYGHLLVVVCLILLSYILLLAFGPSTNTPGGLMVQVGGQKVVAYVLIGGITLLALGALRSEHKATPAPATLVDSTK